jgi:hypothetical protein
MLVDGYTKLSQKIRHIPNTLQRQKKKAFSIFLAVNAEQNEKDTPQQLSQNKARKVCSSARRIQCHLQLKLALSGHRRKDTQNHGHYFFNVQLRLQHHGNGREGIPF